MLLLSDYEINAYPKGRVKRNEAFNIILTLFRCFTTVQVCSTMSGFSSKQENPVTILSNKKGGCGTYVERVCFHHYICAQVTFSYLVKEPISIRLPSGSAT